LPPAPPPSWRAFTRRVLPTSLPAPPPVLATPPQAPEPWSGLPPWWWTCCRSVLAVVRCSSWMRRSSAAPGSFPTLAIAWWYVSVAASSPRSNSFRASIVLSVIVGLLSRVTEPPSWHPRHVRGLVLGTMLGKSQARPCQNRKAGLGYLDLGVQGGGRPHRRCCAGLPLSRGPSSARIPGPPPREKK